jgi:hypothetical protein
VLLFGITVTSCNKQVFLIVDANNKDDDDDDDDNNNNNNNNNSCLE